MKFRVRRRFQRRSSADRAPRSWSRDRAASSSPTSRVCRRKTSPCEPLCKKNGRNGTFIQNKYRYSNKTSSAVLLGLGCRTASVYDSIFSVNIRVFSARCTKLSKWASSSVFSAWPSFSSVYYTEKRLAIINLYMMTMVLNPTNVAKFIVNCKFS